MIASKAIAFRFDSISSSESDRKLPLTRRTPSVSRKRADRGKLVKIHSVGNFPISDLDFRQFFVAAVIEYEFHRRRLFRVEIGRPREAVSDRESTTDQRTKKFLQRRRITRDVGGMNSGGVAIGLEEVQAGHFWCEEKAGVGGGHERHGGGRTTDGVKVE